MTETKTLHPLRAFRQRNRLTLDDLAETAETTAAQLSRIETGNSNPSFSLMVRLVEISQQKRLKGKLAVADFINVGA